MLPIRIAPEGTLHFAPVYMTVAAPQQAFLTRPPARPGTSLCAWVHDATGGSFL